MILVEERETIFSGDCLGTFEISLLQPICVRLADEGVFDVQMRNEEKD